VTDVFDKVVQFLNHDTGFRYVSAPMVIMWALCGLLFTLAIRKKHEPLFLMSLAFGMLLANLPTGGRYDGGWSIPGISHPTAGLFYYIGQGINLGLYPPIIFLGIGALTDFGPLIANPRMFFLGGATQIGAFAAMFCAVASGMFTVGEAASIGISGGAAAPIAIFAANRLAVSLIGPIAIAAYACLGLAPLIQPPIMKALTTDAERRIRMKGVREVSKPERVAFPLIVMMLCILVAPRSSSLLAMLMFGSVLRESGVTESLVKSCQNEILNVTTILLGAAVGMTMRAETFLRPATLAVIFFGVAGFALSTASGVVMAKIMNMLSPNSPINPLIGSAGVSALPIAAKVSQQEGLLYDPYNCLLMHATGPNVAGVIGTALTAGYLMSRLL
jgi:oxaloacetate decarboxylase beta subunit